MDKNGVEKTSRVFELASETLLRLAAGLSVRRATITHVEHKLAELEK
jgi:hypothetical protein